MLLTLCRVSCGLVEVHQEQTGASHEIPKTNAELFSRLTGVVSGPQRARGSLKQALTLQVCKATPILLVFASWFLGPLFRSNEDDRCGSFDKTASRGGVVSSSVWTFNGLGRIRSDSGPGRI